MSKKKEIFTIRSRKFDGAIHRHWEAELITRSKTLLTFAGFFKDEINHSNLGVIRPGTISYEFYWINCWFNVFRFHEPNGELRNYYCNITQPPIVSGNALDYVDLDIDVLIWKDFSFEILDLDEYKDSAGKFNYSIELKSKVDDGLGELLNRLKNKSFPFNFKA